MMRQSDWADAGVDAATSRRMAAVRRTGTKPEVEVRSIVTALGSRYTVANADLPGSPDLANRRRRWAILVHGCFWHRHPRCPRARIPARNAALWLEKFDRNVQRDALAIQELRALGFRVLVVWECRTGDSATRTVLRRFLRRDQAP